MKRNVVMSRREVLAGLSAAVGVSAVAKTQTRAANSSERVIVIGAGVFGEWTAWHLLKSGRRVTLVDAWGPAHARASSAASRA